MKIQKSVERRRTEIKTPATKCGCITVRAVTVETVAFFVELVPVCDAAAGDADVVAVVVVLSSVAVPVVVIVVVVVVFKEVVVVVVEVVVVIGVVEAVLVVLVVVLVRRLGGLQGQGMTPAPRPTFFTHLSFLTE